MLHLKKSSNCSATVHSTTPDIWYFLLLYETCYCIELLFSCMNSMMNCQLPISGTRSCCIEPPAAVLNSYWTVQTVRPLPLPISGTAFCSIEPPDTALLFGCRDCHLPMSIASFCCIVPPVSVYRTCIWLLRLFCHYHLVPPATI